MRLFYGEALRINPNASKITGVVCGVRVEEIEDPLMQKIRWLDKLVDKLAKGRATPEKLYRLLRALTAATFAFTRKNPVLRPGSGGKRGGREYLRSRPSR